MVLAKSARMKPRDLAEKLCAAIPASAIVARTEIVGPGFINVFLSADAYHDLPDRIRAQGEQYGTSKAGLGRRVMVEFVSAESHGPAACWPWPWGRIWRCACRVLRAAGFEAVSEYYINDAGRQMDILAVSVWLRYLNYAEKQSRSDSGLPRRLHF